MTAADARAAEHFTVRTADGRTLTALVAGPAGGLPLVFQPGTPSGLVAPPAAVDAAAGAGMRYVQYARPGYGGSFPAPRRRVIDAAADVAAVLDHLGADEFVTAGWSGGGPHALATASGLPDRCLAVASVACPAPLDAAGLDWMAGMAQENIAEFTAAMDSREEIAAFLTLAAKTLSEVTAEQLAAGLGDLASATDLAAVAGEFGGYLAASFRAALTSGIAGWRDDDLAFVTDWGFAVSELAVPVSLWQGGQDAMVPFAHGQWLAGAIPAARAHLLPGEGHLTLVASHLDEIAAELAELAKHR